MEEIERPDGSEPTPGPADELDPVGLFGDQGPKYLSVGEILRIVESRTGTSIHADDPITAELVALDVAMRHYTSEMLKLVALQGALLDRQAKSIAEQVGDRIDTFAAGAVKAIESNSAAVKDAITESKSSVDRSTNVMTRVTGTAKFLLVVTAAIGAVVVTALTVTAFFVLAGR